MAGGAPRSSSAFVFMMGMFMGGAIVYFFRNQIANLLKGAGSTGAAPARIYYASAYRR